MLLLVRVTQAQDTFYDVNTIQKIEIYFTQSNWDYMMDTAKIGSDGFILASWVIINGTKYDSVGVKYKGNSSYDATYIKNPLHIALDEFKSHNYQGYKDIKLSNCYADPSMIREVLAYDILKNYMDCPLSNFAQLYINGSYVGLYSNDESINKTFCAKRFSSSKSTLIKANPTINPGPSSKCNLKYLGADSSSYFNFYEIKSDHGWNDLVSLCNTVTNDQSNIASVMDMDKVLWMLAYNSVLVNLDSYSGVFCQNYYLYKDNTGHYNPVVWDLNMSFGGFPYVGSSNTSMGSLTVANMEQLPISIHASDTYWPLINIVMNNGQYRRMYLAHIRTITNEFFVNNSYKTITSQLQAIVDTATYSDPNKFFTYAQFQTSLTSDNVFGSYAVPGIINLMDARVKYLQSNTEYASVSPTILSVTADNPTPAINSSVTVTAKVSNTNADAVYLGYRSNKLQKFTKVLMYDDGNHNDGVANDNIYGASFTMTTALAQYYVYAENNNAGIFSPERAEHEFYALPNTTTSVSEVSSNQELIVYPNPVSQVLHMTTADPKSQTVTVSKLFGTNVYREVFTGNTEINVSDWPGGIYIIIVNGKSPKKIVVVH
jgi:hypothetical protein